MKTVERYQRRDKDGVEQVRVSIRDACGEDFRERTYLSVSLDPNLSGYDIIGDVIGQHFVLASIRSYNTDTKIVLHHGEPKIVPSHIGILDAEEAKCLRRELQLAERAMQRIEDLVFSVDKVLAKADKKFEKGLKKAAKQASKNA